MRIRFLERLQKSKDGLLVTSTENDIKKDIKEHLEKILNTRKGSALINEEYGMDDCTVLEIKEKQEGDGKEIINYEAIQRSLRKLITDFEPRIKVPRVTMGKDIDSKGRLHFKVEARLERDNIDIATNLEIGKKWETE
ncbi:MAG: type VI secretion system baseplate subunit TssE [Candidatus Cloacimonetes bacterium]|nr:type VI secretion system baseplate subunit TssE [Candidatus Cloacimonadota bacterium]